ncbi:MAG: hypothetical protein JWN50_828 [Parcubacteria group bacterium]|nr:hypothetical protein [Parcubacteria group bacterium]
MGDMQRRLALALSISALLIGGATWFRVAHAQNPFKTLTVVNTPAQTNGNQTTIIDTPVAPNIATTTTENLTATDLVGRQFMSDYLSLASNGQATDANVNTLVGNYANNVAGLDSFALYTTADIKIVPTSTQSLQAYSNAVMAIYAKYHGMATAVVKSAGDLSSVDSKNFASTMNILGSFNLKASEDLKTVPVPDTLAVAHLKLVNNNIASGHALESIGNTTSDSVTAYAALSAQAENASETTDALLSIQSTLLANGILFNAGL